MQDDFRKRPADSTRVNANESWQVLKYWTNAFDCDENELRAAIRAVGPDVDKVRAHLSKKGSSDNVGAAG